MTDNNHLFLIIMTKYAFLTLCLSLSFTSITNALTLGDNDTTINQPSIDEYATWRYKTSGLPYKSVNTKTSDLNVDASWQGGTLRITNTSKPSIIIKNVTFLNNGCELGFMKKQVTLASGDFLKLNTEMCSNDQNTKINIRTNRAIYSWFWEIN